MNIASARLYLVHKRAFLATALYSLIPVEKPGLGTMAVDKHYRLYYDPDLKWNPMEIATVLYHEIQHLLRDHPGRGEVHKDEHMIWNIAADCEINDDIRDESQWTLPQGVVYPDKFGMKDNQLAETYFEQLRKNAEKVQGNGTPMGGNCGSAATGKSEEYEDPWDGTSSGQTPGISDVERKLISHKVTEDVKKAKTIGKVPGEWERWAEEILQPKINWRNELRASFLNAIAEVAGMHDYTYRKPARRQSAFGNIVVPSMTQPVVKVAVVVDTSGSMGGDELSQAIAEVGGILKSLGMREGVTVLSVDAAVHSCQKVFSANQIQVAGGGGTDMGVGIKKAAKLKPKPDIIVVLTDGYTPWPENAPPKTKVIVGIIGGSLEGIPSYAKGIMIEDRDAA